MKLFDLLYPEKQVCVDMTQSLSSLTYIILLYRHKCYTGICTTKKIHTKPLLGLRWYIREDIADLTDTMFDP